MGSKREYLFERRAFLRTLGIGGGLYGLSQPSGATGTMQRGAVGSAAGMNVAGSDSIAVSTFMEEIVDELSGGFETKIEAKIDEWKNSGWGEVVDNLREITDLVTDAADDAFETIDDALRRVEFILDHSSQIATAIGDKAAEIRAESEDEGDESEESEESEASLGQAAPSSGAGAGATGSVTLGSGATTRSVHSSVTEEIGNAVDDLKNAADGLVDFVDQLDDEVRETFNDYWDGAQEFVNDIESGIRDLIDPAVDAIVELIVTPVDRFTDVWESAASGDGLPSFDMSYDVLDIDMGVEIDSLVGSIDENPTFDAAAASAGAAGNGPRSATAGSSASMSAAPGPLPIDPQILQIDDCKRAPGPVHAFGVEFSMFEIPVVGTERLSFTPYLGLGWAPCFFYGAEANTDFGLDISGLYEALVLFQDSWATVANELEADAENMITTLEEASTLGDLEDAAVEIQQFVDSTEERLEPHGIPLSLLMDELSPEVDLMELLETAENLEQNVIETVERLLNSSLADAIVELDDVINAIDLDEDPPSVETIADVGGDIAEANIPDEIKEITVEDLARLSRGYRAFATWLEGLDEAERERIEAETGVDIDVIESNLELITQQTLDVGEWVNETVDKTLKPILERLKTKAGELAIRTYDIAPEWDGFECQSSCIDPSRIKRAVATLAIMPVVVGVALADFLYDEFFTTWLPGAIDWVGRWATRILVVLGVVGMALSVYAVVVTLGGIGSVGTVAPEAVTSVAGIALLAIAVALLAGQRFILTQAAESLGADPETADRYATGERRM